MRLRLMLALLAATTPAAQAAPHDWWVLDQTNATCTYLPNFDGGQWQNPLQYETYYRNRGSTFDNKIYHVKDGSEIVQATQTFPSGSKGYVQFFTAPQVCNSLLAFFEKQGTITPPSALQ